MQTRKLLPNQWMAMQPKPHHPIDELDGAKVGPFVLRLDRVKQLRQSGWKGFCLDLEDGAGRRGAPAVIKGIFSRGGKDGVRPWLDVVYRQRVVFEARGPENDRSVDLAGAELETALFAVLGGLIPGGGHLMVSYEEDDPIHMETMMALRKNVPPVVTPLGLLLFASGFSMIKNWYLSEGGHEGPRKLWAEKAPDPRTETDWRETTARHLKEFLLSISEGETDLVKTAAAERAASLLRRLAH